MLKSKGGINEDFSSLSYINGNTSGLEKHSELRKHSVLQSKPMVWSCPPPLSSWLRCLQKTPMKQPLSHLHLRDTGSSSPAPGTPPPKVPFLLLFYPPGWQRSLYSAMATPALLYSSCFIWISLKKPPCSNTGESSVQTESIKCFIYLLFTLPWFNTKWLSQHQDHFSTFSKWLIAQPFPPNFFICSRKDSYYFKLLLRQVLSYCVCNL